MFIHEWSTDDPTYCLNLFWEILGGFGRACQVELRPDTVGRLGPHPRFDHVNTPYDFEIFRIQSDIYIYIRTLIYKLCIQMYSAYIYIHIQSGTTLRISSSGNNSCASLYSYIQDHRRPSLVTWRRLREAEVSAWVLEGSDGEVECTGYHRRIIFCF